MTPAGAARFALANGDARPAIALVWLTAWLCVPPPLLPPGSQLLILGGFAALLAGPLETAGLLTWAGTLAFRLFCSPSPFRDQHYIQWFSATVLLNGQSLYAPTALSHSSWAFYLPAGNLFGGALIALGIHAYWQVWHVLIMLAFALPALAKPSAATVGAGVFWISAYPLASYTASGASTEVAAATEIATFHLMLRGRFLHGAVAAAYCCMLRQNHLVLIPFIALYLFRHGERRALALFAALLMAFGGVFIAMDPGNFYTAAIRFHTETGAQMFFNDAKGLYGDYSIAGALFGLGLPVDWIWTSARHLYLPLTGAVVMALFVWAAVSKETGRILLLGGLAAAAVYVFARGYTHYIYLIGASSPLLIFAGERTAEGEVAARSRWAEGLVTAAFAAFGFAPLLMYGWGLLGPPRLPDSPPAAVQAFPASGRQIRLGDPLEIRFDRPLRVKAVRLTGPGHIWAEVNEVGQWVPPPGDIVGALTRGELWFSADGVSFSGKRDFSIASNHSVVAAVVPVKEEQPARAIRIIARKAFLDTPTWTIAKVEVFE